jgi:hypothetical protein
VQFTPQGERTGFELDIVHLSENGLSKVRENEIFAREIEFHLDWNMVTRTRCKFYFYASSTWRII